MRKLQQSFEEDRQVIKFVLLIFDYFFGPLMSSYPISDDGIAVKSLRVLFLYFMMF